MVSTPVIHVLTCIINLPTPKGCKAELAWLFDPLRSGHMSTVDQVSLKSKNNYFCVIVNRIFVIISFQPSQRLKAAPPAPGDFL